MKSGRTLLLILLLTTSSVSAFDHDRSGLVLGAGVGLSPAVSMSQQFTWMGAGQNVSREVKDQVRIGINAHALAGWGFDDNDILLFYTDLNAITNGGKREFTLFTGVVWSHYFLNTKPAMFSTMGLGQYRYLPRQEPRVNAAGPGMLLGGGFLLSPHLQVGLYLTHGSSSGVNSRTDIDRDHFSASIGLTALAF